MRWTAIDEGRHDDARGVESWGFGFQCPDATGEIRLAFDVANARASFIVDLSIARFGRIVVADESVALPRAQAGLEIRADGLWASLYCETPFEHWSLGLEAFGLRIEADAMPSDAVGGATAWDALIGERLAVGFDVEWELSGPPEPLVDGNGYRQVGTIFGDLLVVRDRLEVDGRGWRDHWWGT